MINIPHFDYPFRLNADGHVVVVEQDSSDEIESCLISPLTTEKGQRIELPKYGIDSMLFELQPLPLDRLLNTIIDQEPRAVTILSQQPDKVDYLTALVEVDLISNQPPIGES